MLGWQPEPSRRCSDVVANESSKACNDHASRYDPHEEHEQGENAWVQVRRPETYRHSFLEAACKMAPSAEPAAGQRMLDSATDLTWLCRSQQPAQSTLPTLIWPSRFLGGPRACLGAKGYGSQAAATTTRAAVTGQSPSSLSAWQVCKSTSADHPVP